MFSKVQYSDLNHSTNVMYLYNGNCMICDVTIH